MRVHIVRRSLLELSRSKVEIVETVSYLNNTQQSPIIRLTCSLNTVFNFIPGGEKNIK